MTRIIGTPPPPGAIVRAKLFEELRSFPWTDTGNAEAFCRLFAHRLKHNHSRKRWMVWNGLHWVPDSDGEAERAPAHTRAMLERMEQIWAKPVSRPAEMPVVENPRRLLKRHSHATKTAVAVNA